MEITWTHWEHHRGAWLENGTGLHLFLSSVKPSMNPRRYLRYLNRSVWLNKATGESDRYSGQQCRFDFPAREDWNVHH